MPSRCPARSGTARTVDPVPATREPIALENGTKVRSAPAARCRDTHNQSDRITSTRPACNASCAAGTLASSNVSMRTPCFSLKPQRAMTSSSQLNVPYRSDPTRMVGSACAAALANQRNTTARQRLRKGVALASFLSQRRQLSEQKHAVVRGTSIGDDAANGFARMHQVKPLVDLVERELVGDQIVDVDFAFHVPVDNFRHVGAPTRTAKGGSFPDASGDELERSRRDFLARAGDADDDADPPTAMGAFERLAHDIDIADALEAVIGAAFGEIYKIRDEVALDFLRVDEMGHAEFFGHFPPLRVQVDTHDHIGTGHSAALDYIEPDAAEAENNHISARLDLGSIDHRPNPGRDPAADIADLVEGGVLADLRDRDLWQYGEIRKGRRAHVVVDLTAAERKAAGAVRHHPLALRGADRDTEIGLARKTILALAAFRSVERDDMVALGDARHAASDIDDDAGPFMAEYRREKPLRIAARQRKLVRVADPRRFDFDKHLSILRAVELNLFDLERLSGLESNSGASLQSLLLGFELTRAAD